MNVTMIQAHDRVLATARSRFLQASHSEGLGLLVVLYALIAGATFALITPAFEAPDEPSHLAYVNFVARSGALPNAYESPMPLRGEAHQHPLYYVLGGALVRALTADHEITVTISPNSAHIWNGGGQEDVPVNNPPDWAAPSAETAFYSLRLLSVCLALGTIWYILRLGALVFGRSGWRFVPALFVATLPQFLFISGSVNNDNLVNLGAAAALFYTFALLRDPGSTRIYLLLALWTGIGLLSKQTALFILPSIAAVVAYVIARCPSLRKRIAVGGLVCALLVLILSGSVFIRNQVIYGDPLALQVQKITLPGLVQEKTILSRYFWRPAAFPGLLYDSFVGQFGWMQFVLPQVVYGLYGVLFAFAGVGIILHLRSVRVRSAPVWFAGLSVVLSLASVVALNLSFSQPQGRLLFPALAPLGLLVAIGLRSLTGYVRTVTARRVLIYALSSALVLGDGLALHQLWVIYARNH